jgi:hypothetical protein
MDVLSYTKTWIIRAYGTRTTFCALYDFKLWWWPHAMKCPWEVNYKKVELVSIQSLCYCMYLCQKGVFSSVPLTLWLSLALWVCYWNKTLSSKIISLGLNMLMATQLMTSAMELQAVSRTLNTSPIFLWQVTQEDSIAYLV